MDEGQQDVRILPEHILTFYRNEFQSAATISILRQPTCKQIIKYELKSTHRHAYLVSSAKGEIREDSNHKYIDILINEQFPLEQCLLDRFKLLVRIKDRQPIQKTFKVVINYKKDVSRIKQSSFNGIEVASKTSATSTAPSTSLLGHPISLARKSMLKQSKIANYLTKNQDSQGVNLKQHLDEVVKSVEDRRMRLQYLGQQLLKRKSRKKFGCYIMVLAMLFSLLMGIVFHKTTDLGVIQLL